MGVLFGFGDAELGQTLFGNILAENVVQLLGLEGHFHIGHGSIILGKADEMGLDSAAGTVEAVKFLVAQGSGDLSGPVGAEIVEDHAVTALDAPCAFHTDRLHELVGNAVLIGFFHCFGAFFHGVGLALHQCVISLLQALPALVAIHGIKTTADHAQTDLFVVGFGQTHLQTADKVGAAFGRSITTVQKAVDTGLDLVLFAQVDEGKQVDQMAVHAAVGQQAHQMHRTAGLFSVFHRTHQCGIFKKAVVPDVPGDAGQLLIHHPACADVGVTHLAVTHLSVGQTHILTRAVHAGVGTGLKQPIQIGGLCRGDSIGPAGRGNAPAVQNH